MMLLRKLKINYRIWIINLLAVVGMLGILALALDRQYKDLEKEKLNQEIGRASCRGRV